MYQKTSLLKLIFDSILFSFVHKFINRCTQMATYWVTVVFFYFYYFFSFLNHYTFINIQRNIKIYCHYSKKSSLLMIEVINNLQRNYRATGEWIESAKLPNSRGFLFERIANAQVFIFSQYQNFRRSKNLGSHIGISKISFDSFKDLRQKLMNSKVVRAMCKLQAKQNLCK